MPDFFQDDLFPQSLTSTSARVYEENNQLHVEVPVQGMNLEDIDVRVYKGVLSVKGHADEEENDESSKYYSSSQSDFSFSISLPKPINEKQKPQAVYLDGILKVSMELVKREKSGKISERAGKNKSDNIINVKNSGNDNVKTGNGDVSTSKGKDKKSGNGKLKKK